MAGLQVQDQGMPCADLRSLIVARRASVLAFAGAGQQIRLEDVLAQKRRGQIALNRQEAVRKLEAKEAQEAKVFCAA